MCIVQIIQSYDSLQYVLDMEGEKQNDYDYDIGGYPFITLANEGGGGVSTNSNFG